MYFTEWRRVAGMKLKRYQTLGEEGQTHATGGGESSNQSDAEWRGPWRTRIRRRVGRPSASTPTAHDGCKTATRPIRLRRAWGQVAADPLLDRVMMSAVQLPDAVPPHLLPRTHRRFVRRWVPVAAFLPFSSTHGIVVNKLAGPEQAAHPVGSYQYSFLASDIQSTPARNDIMNIDVFVVRYHRRGHLSESYA